MIELTPTQHAMFHYCEWKLWGCQQDYIAWKALSGQVTFSDSSLKAWEDGAKRGGHTQGRRNAESGHLAKISRIHTPIRDAASRKSGAHAVSSGQLEAARQAYSAKRAAKRQVLYDTICELKEGGFTHNEITQFIDTSVAMIRRAVRIGEGREHPNRNRGAVDS